MPYQFFKSQKDSASHLKRIVNFVVKRCYQYIRKKVTLPDTKTLCIDDELLIFLCITLGMRIIQDIAILHHNEVIDILADEELDIIPTVWHNAEDVYRLLQQLPTQNAEHIIYSYINSSDFEKKSQLLEAFNQKNKEKFVRLLNQEGGNFNKLQKIISTIELPEKICSELNDLVTSDVDVSKWYNHILTFAKRKFPEAYVNRIQTQLQIVLSMYNDFEKYRINHTNELNSIAEETDKISELLESTELTTAEREEYTHMNQILSQQIKEGQQQLLNKLNDFVRNVTDLQYTFSVQCFLRYQSHYTQAEQDLYLEYATQPPYDVLFHKIEDDYYQVGDDCPFINLTKAQLATIINFLKTKATQRPGGNRSKNKGICVQEVYYVIRALIALEKYIVSEDKKEEFSTRKMLAEWLDHNIPNGKFSTKDGIRHLGEYIKEKNHLDGGEIVKKYVEELAEQGFTK